MPGIPSSTRFAGWLQASMTHRGLTQAQLARSVGVADTQISRWRRGQVVPSVQYLQRLADTFGIDRITLDQLVGLPVAQAGATGTRVGGDPAVEAELQAHQARLRQVMQRKLPRSMWRAYVEACVALAEGLGAQATHAVRESLGQAPDDASPARLPADDFPARDAAGGESKRDEPPPERHLGFRH